MEGFLFSESVIDPGLIEAYRQTHYRVTEGRPFTLLIDAHSPELAALQEQRHVTSSAFVTIVWSGPAAVPQLILLR
jgi:hypothetical protein